MEDSEIKVTLTVKQLEELIRKIVRKEIAQLAFDFSRRKESDVFYLDEDSPLYSDMIDILERKEQGKLNFYTHEEVWGE